MEKVNSNPPSHLTVLINRVKAEEQQFGYATKEHLINIAEYILSWDDYSPIEYQNAIALLAKYHLAKLANTHPKYRKQSWLLIEKELNKKYKARCKRCGLPITNEISLHFGHGPVCRKKLGLNMKNQLAEEDDFKLVEAEPLASKVQVEC